MVTIPAYSPITGFGFYEFRVFRYVFATACRTFKFKLFHFFKSPTLKLLRRISFVNILDEFVNFIPSLMNLLQIALDDSNPFLMRLRPIFLLRSRKYRRLSHLHGPVRLFGWEFVDDLIGEIDSG